MATAPKSQILPATYNVPLAPLPPTCITDSFDARKAAETFVENFNAHLATADIQSLAALFHETGYWRDHLALTWAFRTVQSPEGVARFLVEAASSRDGLRLKSITLDVSSATRQPVVVEMDPKGECKVVQFFIALETVNGTGTGTVRLAPNGTGCKVFTLGTTLQSLKGFEEPILGRRPLGVIHGEQLGRKNWAELREAAEAYTDGSEPTVIIVGAGQAGLTASVRLKMLGINALTVDSGKRIGDNWRNRYHHLTLHDPVWYDHMPYMPFPPNWPIFTPKDKLGYWFESYAKNMELNVWMRTELAQTKWDASSKKWTVVLNRIKPDGTQETRTFHPRHIIQATGHSGKKSMPNIDGIDQFQGHLLCHSSEFPGARADGQGRKAVVIGCCNSGHDISQSLYENGYDVTMVQRSSTVVVSSEVFVKTTFKDMYCEGGPPVDEADLLQHGMPSSVLKTLQRSLCATQREHDKALRADLEAAGFRLNDGPDDAGLFFKYFERGGGYYIDVGASRLIAEGKIKIKQGQEVTRVLQRGVQFGDGTELEADEVIFATGYEDMGAAARDMYGDALGNGGAQGVWGMTEEGEFRTMWQDSGHPGFWFHGGNIALCRYYSRLLALQIKGLDEGLYKQGEK